MTFGEGSNARKSRAGGVCQVRIAPRHPLALWLVDGHYTVRLSCEQLKQCCGTILFLEFSIELETPFCISEALR